jgi:ABC-2 type transport system ATP-binding protein
MITVKNLTRRFGSITAVSDVSFSVAPGEVLGFLGPNGAGKTTTMRMITGYLDPSEGEAVVKGIKVADDPVAAKAKMGYLPENAPVYRDMDVLSFLRFIASVRGLRGAVARQAVDRAIAVSHLESVVRQSIDTLSKGYVRRTSFAQAILHDPPVLILDEPTDGLDPNQKHEVRAMIHEMGRDKAIIISTHILEEVEACCSRALIIARGRIVANGTPAELKARSRTAGTVVLAADCADVDALATALGGLGGVTRCEILERSGAGARFRLSPSVGTAGDLAVAVAGYARERSLAVRELVTDAGRLDDVFRTITTEEDAA